MVNIITDPPAIMMIHQGKFTLKCETCGLIDTERSGAMDRLRNHVSETHSCPFVVKFR